MIGLGKYDDIISKAVELETEYYLTLNGSDIDCKLRARSYLSNLKNDVAILSAGKNASVLGKLKDALFYSKEDKDRENAHKSAIDNIFQLKKCLSCLCPNCARNDESCNCAGCLYSSRVIKCEDNIETREPEKGAIQLDGAPLIKTEYDRRTNRTVATVSYGESEKKLNLDIASGKTSPYS